MSRLLNFAAGTLRLLPTSLWWVLALLAGAVGSITLEKEVFPNTPAAVQVAKGVVLAGLLALPCLGVVWLWRVAGHVQHPGWRLLWRLAASGATGVAVCLGLLLLVVALLSLL